MKLLLSIFLFGYTALQAAESHTLSNELANFDEFVLKNTEQKIIEKLLKMPLHEIRDLKNTFKILDIFDDKRLFTLNYMQQIITVEDGLTIRILNINLCKEDQIITQRSTEFIDSERKIEAAILARARLKILSAINNNL
jgi:hypothetical protein